MSGKKATGAGCAICGKRTVKEYSPFCSVRCKELDLGNWLGGKYAIAGKEPINLANDNDEMPED